jgi:hypothetical protein
VSDDIEQRLAAAAQALREFEVTGQRCDDLASREHAIAAKLEALRSEYADETKGARQEQLARERGLTGSPRHPMTTPPC